MLPNLEFSLGTLTASLEPSTAIGQQYCTFLFRAVVAKAIGANVGQKASEAIKFAPRRRDWKKEGGKKIYFFSFFANAENGRKKVRTKPYLRLIGHFYSLGLKNLPEEKLASKTIELESTYRRYQRSRREEKKIFWKALLLLSCFHQEIPICELQYSSMQLN